MYICIISIDGGKDFILSLPPLYSSLLNLINYCAK